MNKIITLMILLSVCNWWSAVAQSPDSEDELNKLMNELRMLGAQQKTKDLGNIPVELDSSIALKGAPLIPTVNLDNVDIEVSSGIDVLGAIQFAEKFLTAAYFEDFSKMKSMICNHPDVRAFWTDDVYRVALKEHKKEGMRLNFENGIYSKCVGFKDLDMTTFTNTDDIPGYHKVNVYFDADSTGEDAEFVGLRVMVFQNIEDGQFSIFSIK